MSFQAIRGTGVGQKLATAIVEPRALILNPAGLLCTGLFIRDDLLIRLLKSALKSTDHGMLKSTGHGMLKSTQVANNEISHMVVAAEGRHTMWEGGRRPPCSLFGDLCGFQHAMTC